MESVRKIIGEMYEHLIAPMSARAKATTAASVALLLVMAAIWHMVPQNTVERERDLARKLNRGDVVEVAESPEGQKVWAVESQGRTVYFTKGSVAIAEAPKADPQ